MISILTSKAAPWVIAALFLFGALALGFAAIGTVRNIINDAVAVATAARDAHWQGEVDRANAAAAWNIIEQMRASRAADLAARAEISRLNNQLSQLEAKNEGLPDRDGSGIDRARARLLNNEPLADDPHGFRAR